MDFRYFCLNSFHMRGKLDQLLRLRLSKEELKRRSAVQKIDLVYQCSIEHEYQDLTDVKRDYSAFILRTAGDRARPLALMDDEKMVIQYIKSMLIPGQHYTMPGELFDLCVAGVAEAATNNASPLKRCLDASVAQDIDFNPVGVVAFVVAHNKPEDQNVMQPTHVPRPTTCIEVRRFKVTHRGALERLMLESPDEGFTTLTIDLRGFATHIDRVTHETRRWEVLGRRSNPTLVDLPISAGVDWLGQGPGNYLAQTGAVV